ncbi:MarR family winged helix-turn-helix transcriptional regulator [Aquibacillus sediminis]|uniref:MarR family winged helix-turn-helix transcriptional regulator n=1 Tax=Aquibacillus sediminis TaxID=2574734 RepID=UPI001486929A|nr:MarR family transcriptional regulator [Aquibacillus sediminis]
MDVKIRQELTLMIRALYFCVENRWGEIGKAVELSTAQQHLLFLLSTNENALTPTEIGKLGCWHVSTVTRLVKTLQSRGIVEVNNHPNKSRFKLVSMTDDGKDVLRQIHRSFRQMDQVPFELESLSEQQIKAFIQTGQKLLDVHKGEEYRSKVINAHIKESDLA